MNVEQKTLLLTFLLISSTIVLGATISYVSKKINVFLLLLILTFVLFLYLFIGDRRERMEHSR